MSCITMVTEATGPEEVGAGDKIDAPACHVEEFGLNPVYSKSNCFFLEI